MGGAGPRGALAVAVSRNLPLAISGAVRRFTEDPWRGRVALERAWRRAARPVGEPRDALRRAVALDDLAAAEAAVAALAPDETGRSADAALLLLRGRLGEALRA